MSKLHKEETFLYNALIQIYLRVADLLEFFMA